MKQHPRVIPVRLAERAIDDAVAGVEHRYGLTGTELLTILNGVIASRLKSMLRVERHPDDPSQPADVE